MRNITQSANVMALKSYLAGFALCGTEAALHLPFGIPADHMGLRIVGGTLLAIASSLLVASAKRDYQNIGLQVSESAQKSIPNPEQSVQPAL